MLTLQNGLGNLERIEAEVGPARAVAGVTAQAATLLAPGQVRHAGRGPTTIGVRPGQEQRLEAIAALFNRAGIDTNLSDDVDSLLWSKLIVNVGINALTALLRVPNGVLARFRNATGSWPRPWPRRWRWPAAWASPWTKNNSWTGSGWSVP